MAWVGAGAMSAASAGGPPSRAPTILGPPVADDGAASARARPALASGSESDEEFSVYSSSASGQPCGSRSRVGGGAGAAAFLAKPPGTAEFRTGGGGAGGADGEEASLSPPLSLSGPSGTSLYFSQTRRYISYSAVRYFRSSASTSPSFAGFLRLYTLQRSLRMRRMCGPSVCASSTTAKACSGGLAAASGSAGRDAPGPGAPPAQGGLSFRFGARAKLPGPQATCAAIARRSSSSSRGWVLALHGGGDDDVDECRWGGLSSSFAPFVSSGDGGAGAAGGGDGGRPGLASLSGLSSPLPSRT